MIELKNISLTFQPGSSSQMIGLDDINLSIAKNDIVTVVGANGSGKSSLLNVIAGTVQPDKGSILIDGEEVTRFKDFERSRWVARIFQNPLAGTASEMSVIENFRLASLRTKNKSLREGINIDFRKTVQEKISILQMNIENKLDQPMGSLSGGQRQALTLAMAVMDQAKVLLMDEPAASLDPRSAEILMENADKIIKQYSLTVLMVTHSLKDAHRYGNRIIQMKEGKIIRDLTVLEKGKLSLSDLYSWF